MSDFNPTDLSADEQALLKILTETESDFDFDEYDSVEERVEARMEKFSAFLGYYGFNSNSEYRTIADILNAHLGDFAYDFIASEDGSVIGHHISVDHPTLSFAHIGATLDERDMVGDRSATGVRAALSIADTMMGYYTSLKGV